jgi:lipopolysaccharide transport system ATP-binding protein
MSDTVIRVENLGKKYILAHQQEGQSYTALRDVLANKAKSLGRRFKPHSLLPTPHSPSQEEFWALKDVSFEIKQGDRVGIIGRNGAGKSTLLKILSRITEPTTGQIRIKGRVASLLEVGTGFHPELTGRENIYLNGAILGMSRVEIRRKFDEIVAFAEVERFLDTPVKRYSSGMYVRLAFAVAAHLEPEILIVDEVLAVGDAQFQKKCLGKMEDVSREGRTVLFVSHNLTAMQTLCQTGIYLKGGCVNSCGAIDDQVKCYLADQTKSSQFSSLDFNRSLLLKKIKLSTQVIHSGDFLEVDLEIADSGPDSDSVLELALIIYTLSGTRVAIADLRKTKEIDRININFSGMIKLKIESLPLIEGDYRLGLWIKTRNFSEELENLSELKVLSKVHKSGFIPYAPSDRGFFELEFDVLRIISSRVK